ncbi:MAG TPA: class I SAM-dependent methyltransferase [Dehalococcoidia bacterium]|nr:class I SAM-dependent methyltransferase [Dehalococcoidia bacterium]
MLKRIEHQEEAIEDVDEVRRYAEVQRRAKYMYRPLVKELQALHVTGHYLEIGAGPGLLAAMLAVENPNLAITAIDLSSQMADVASEYFRDHHLQERINYIIGDVNDENVVLGLGKFDLVYSTLSLHHWKEPEKSIRNLWRVVKENGTLYIYDFKRVWWLYFLPGTNFIKAAYNSGEIEEMLHRSHIKSYKIKTLFPYCVQSIIATK